MSIIGMPILLLASGTLCVTSMKDATVVFKRDGVTYKTVTSYTADSDGWHGKYYCRVPFGTWTVESTWDGETKSKTTVVNTTGQTDVKIIHTIYIFKAGVGLKNGFSAVKTVSGCVLNINANRIHQESGESAYSGFYITPAIPSIGDFKTLRVTGTSAGFYGTLTVGISSNASSYQNFAASRTGCGDLGIGSFTSGTYYIKTFRSNGPATEEFTNILLLES